MKKLKKVDVKSKTKKPVKKTKKPEKWVLEAAAELLRLHENEIRRGLVVQFRMNNDLVAVQYDAETNRYEVIHALVKFSDYAKAGGDLA